MKIKEAGNPGLNTELGMICKGAGIPQRVGIQE